MKRTTIDFGIDLGTTNSAIAVLKGVSPEIIKNNDADADITPSAVSIDKRGLRRVGLRARNHKDGIREFKRRMGSGPAYEIASSGETCSPEELSAEVLKSLKADVEQRLGESIRAAVITVPAAFEHHQCEATKRAALLAGLDPCPLLQEPVAAALAFGFQTDAKKAYWMVYDMGGGTFDAAVIKAEEGTINVVNHGGDNFLGGSDIDWALVEKIIVPQIVEDYALTGFERGNPVWRSAFATIKRSVENAKIELSRLDRTALDECVFKDAAGEEVEVDYELTLDDLKRVASPIIDRSVSICRDVLKEKHLPSDAVEKVILVGGATLAPYLREILQDRLQIPVDHSVDPLTVVARGAAIFAGNQKLSVPSVAGADGDFTIELKYNPVGMETEPMVGGRVVGNMGEDVGGFSLEFVDSSSGWSSGRIPIGSDGVFMTELFAERGKGNDYSIGLFDPTGSKRNVTPDSLSYSIGAVAGELLLMNSMGVALANNDCERLFAKGEHLPLTASGDYRTLETIRQGIGSDVFRIPVVEGENGKADLNRKVGSLEINGDMIRRDLPSGSEVEVTLKMDESRIIRVMAYIPVLDEQFEVKFDSVHSGPQAEELDNAFETVSLEISELADKAERSGEDATADRLDELRNSHLLEEIQETLDAAEGDPDAALKCEKRLLELRLKLDDFSSEIEWPTLAAEAQQWLDDLNNLLDGCGNGEQREKAADLSEELEEVLESRKTDRLRKMRTEIERLYWQIVTDQPSFWVGQLQSLERRVDQMKDPTRASRLFSQGRQCVDENNVEGLRNIVRHLWELLPREVAEAARRGYQSGLTR